MRRESPPVTRQPHSALLHESSLGELCAVEAWTETQEALRKVDEFHLTRSLGVEGAGVRWRAEAVSEGGACSGAYHYELLDHADRVPLAFLVRERDAGCSGGDSRLHSEGRELGTVLETHTSLTRSLSCYESRRYVKAADGSPALTLTARSTDSGPEATLLRFTLGTDGEEEVGRLECLGVRLKMELPSETKLLVLGACLAQIRRDLQHPELQVD